MTIRWWVQGFGKVLDTYRKTDHVERKINPGKILSYLVDQEISPFGGAHG